MLPISSRLRIFYLLYLSKPTADRPIFRAISRQKACKFLELGIGVGRRAVRMIEVAGQFTPLRKIHYAGIDPFEAERE